MYTLTRISLAPEWVYFSQDLSVSHRQGLCTSWALEGGHSHIYDCGSMIAPYYFGLFLVIVSFIMLEMVKAVVLENFTWMYAMDQTVHNKGRMPVSTQDLQRFRQVWADFDPRNTGSITMLQFDLFLARLAESCPSLGKAAGIRTIVGAAQLRAEVEALPSHAPGRVRFKQLFSVLVARCLGREAVMSHEVKRSLEAAQRGARTLQRAGKHLVQSRTNSHEVDAIDGVHDAAAAVLAQHREQANGESRRGSELSLESVGPS